MTTKKEPDNEKQRLTKGNKVMPVSPGRPKGIPNKLTIEVKQMILDALDGAGGVAYLIDKAESHPTAFLSLVGKVLPLQVTGENGGAITVVTKIALVGE